MNNKKFDYILSILSALIGVAILQILFFPLMSRHLNTHKFGEILLVFAIVNSFSLVFGNTLNNIRLINIKKYNDIEPGSFNIFLLVLTIFNAILMFLTLMFLKIDGFESIINIIWSTILLLKSYYIVEFRIKINFKKILISTIIYSFGLLVSLLILINSSTSFYFSFVFAELVSLIYVVANTSLIKEGIKGSFSKNMINDYIILFSSNMLNNFINYIDRFAISFIMGKKFIAIFFAATILGKLSTLIIQPISTVVLSYGVIEETYSKKHFNKMLVTNFLLSIIISTLIYFISVPIIKLLYKTLFTEALPIIFLANLGVVILAVGTIAQSTIMAKGKLLEQFKINSAFLIVFFIVVYPLTLKYKLFGFSIALIVSSISKYISIWFFGKKYFNEC
ncbi:hypothetical protein [Macrococcus capreoli]|uniref:hypothetical protein n=1 Tax=Macrococcus capreoli TaxID=2982690 RepID=UPI003F43D021